MALLPTRRCLISGPHSHADHSPHSSRSSRLGAALAGCLTLIVMLIIGLLATRRAASADVFDCPGDCSGDREVRVDELVTAVNIALGEAAVSGCRRADLDANGQVTVDELIAAVNAALFGCGELGVLASNIQFAPESPAGENRTRLLRVGRDLVFTDGSDFPVKALHLPTRRIRPLVRLMGVPGGLAIRAGSIFWSESRSGIAPSGCAGAGVIRVVNRTSIDRAETTTLARSDDCAQATDDVIASSSHLYWTASLVSPPIFRIMRVPLSGGAATVELSTSDAIEKMMADDTHLYWLQTSIQPGVSGSIRRMAFDGGEPEVVFSELRYFGERQGGFALGGGFLFFANPTSTGSYEITRVPLAGGEAESLGQTAQPPRGYVVVAGTLYWIDQDSLNAVSTDGGPITELASSLESPVDIAAAGAGVIWSESVCCAHGQKGSVKHLRPDGEVEILAQDVDSPVRVASDGQSVFWSEGGPIGLIEGFGRIAARSLSGGEIRTVAQGVSVTLPPVATDGVSVFVADRFRVKRLGSSGGPSRTIAAGDFFVTTLTADAQSVYWVEDLLSTTRRVSIDGGEVDTLATGSGPPRGVAVDATHLYWGEGLDTLNRVPLEGGSAELVASGLAALSDFAIDSGVVYLSEQDTGLIRKLEIGNPAITTLATGMAFSWNYIALSADSVYWINQGHLGVVAKSGGSPAILVQDLDSVAELGNAVLTDAEAVYWSEVGAGTIRALPLHSGVLASQP